jgi:ribonuclease HI
MPNEAQVIIYADGASRGNPGKAAFGIVIHINGKTHRIGHYLGRATNNEAEYQALLAALRWAVEKNVPKVTYYSDSQLVVEQINGRYKVKHPNLKPLFLEALGLKRRLKEFNVFHIRRENNEDADALVNEILDTHKDDSVPTCRHGGCGS